jgi:hypothetical protein
VYVVQLLAKEGVCENNFFPKAILPNFGFGPVSVTASLLKRTDPIGFIFQECLARNPSGRKPLEIAHELGNSGFTLPP